jgi:phosphoribosyl-AMP cyclohydrolase
MKNFIQKVKWNKDGLISATLQDFDSKEVLMVAWMNEEALNKTIEEKKCYFWSRSRQKMWLKGEESGHIHFVKEVRFDCDMDALLIKVVVDDNISCHTGRKSCFYKLYDDDLGLVDEGNVIKNPKEIYKKK